MGDETSDSRQHRGDGHTVFWFELCVDGMCENSNCLDFVILFRIHFHAVDIAFDHRKIERERRSTHECEIFVVVLRILQELYERLINGQATKYFPCVVCVEAIACWIEVVATRKAAVFACFWHFLFHMLTNNDKNLMGVGRASLSFGVFRPFGG